MLIYLDTSLINYLQDCVEIMQEDIEAIDNIFLSHSRRYHLVMATRKCLDALLRVQGISSTTTKQIKIMSHNLTTLSRITREVSNKIIVGPSSSHFQRVSTHISSDYFEAHQCESTIFEVPLKVFSNPDVLEKTRLVGEHLDDCYLYEFLGKEFSKLKNYPFSIKFDRQHGGGNDTYKIFEEKIISNNIVLSLVDSDKRQRQAEIGSTGKGVLRTYAEYKENTISGCEILPVHEKENLFPPIIYEYFATNAKKSALEQLKILADSAVGYLYLPYIDIKKGLNSSNYLPYFEGLFEIENLIPKTYENSRGFENEFIGTKDEFIRYSQEQQRLRSFDRKDKYLIEPMGSNPLINFRFDTKIEQLRNRISELSENKTPQNIIEKEQRKLDVLLNLKNYLLDYQKEYFEIIGTKIKEWGISNYKN